MLSSGQKGSIIYHNLFDYPLTKKELIRWSTRRLLSSKDVSSKDGFYFLSGRQEIIKKRLQNEKESAKKLKIAKRAARVLGKIPTIKLIAITGSLAMRNSSEKSDIDLMIVVNPNTLWLTRLFVIVILSILFIPFRRAGRRDENDRLCLNMWLSVDDLEWPVDDRNIYTAHEIGQILPLVNKSNTYEKFLWENKWILDFWPNSVRINDLRLKNSDSKSFILLPFEKISYFLQYNYMRPKVTREKITLTRALFHPRDWGKVVIDKLKSI